MAKARTDGDRAIVVTPLAVAAPFWNKLLHASVVQNDKLEFVGPRTSLSSWPNGVAIGLRFGHGP